MSMPVSLLAVGDRGWVQTLNFFVDGALLVAFTAGLVRALRDQGTRSMLGPLLIGIVAIGILAAGTFATDPGAGFPPGVAPPSVPSVHGVLHDVASLLVFPVLPVACFTFAVRFASRRQRSLAIYSAISGVILVVAFAVLLLGYNGVKGLFPVAGAAQRLFIIAAWGWIAVLAIHLRRSVASRG